MENENKNKVDSSTQVDAVSYQAGEEAKDANGESVDSSSFSFVQQDKSIHDTKFTTRPTTFMKDAMRRFMKNKSSVVGGVILGVLFLLALILPFSMVSVDISEPHDRETHLPMKLLPAGTGFWDGTTTSTGVAYPYEYEIGENDEIIPSKDDAGKLILNGNAQSSYPDEKDIVKVENVYSQYFDHASSNYSGGYAAIVNNPHSDSTNGYMYFAPMTFNFSSNTYTIKYTLGTLANDEYVVPEYKIIAYSASGITSLTDWRSDYGEAEAKPSDQAQITPHKMQEEDLSALVKAKNYSASGNIAFGFMFKSDAEKMTGFYLKNFEITSTSIKETANLMARSFGTENSAVDDANTMVLEEKTINGNNNNPSYWTTVCDKRFSCVDTFTVLCDITFDMYQVTYGLKNGIEVSQVQMDRWIADGKVEYDYKTVFANKANNPNLNESFVSKDDSVYITEIQNIEMDNNSGEDIYTFVCQVVMYKYLGYDAIPLHLFGTDYQGKDLLKYVFSGLRTSLLLGLIVSAINIIIGIIWGSVSGYFGGMVDITMERLTDILGGVPWIVLMTVLTIKLGTTFFVFALSLCLTGWIGTASTTRSQFYRYRDREYVLAAKTLGARPGRLIFKHILPNAIGTIVTRSVLMIPSTIFSEATISYLGLGLSSLDSLGVILSKNQKYLSTNPSELVFPAIIISLLMICFNLFGNGLRDAFNPSLKGED